MDLYAWDPLPDSREWIRILNLEPGEKEHKLVGSLDAVHISSKPEYEATSYAVGDTNRPNEILLHKQDVLYALSITSSLFGMLRRFRSHTNPRRLWVDAICIAQTNPEEKPNQIQLMHHIYTNTQRALIYLGEPDTKFALATKLMDAIYLAGQDIPESAGPLTQGSQERLRVPTIKEYRSWRPLKDFFCRDWFVRKWTIQECVLPPRTTFHCGDWEKEWDFMKAVIETIHRKSLGVVDYTNIHEVELKTKLQQGLAQFRAVAIFRNHFQQRHRYQLMDTVYHFQISRATDLRDHLFALLGLASDSNHLELRPKYEDATILDNCLRYARFFLAQKNNLEVLYRAGLHGHKLLAPSWIPNWYGKQVDFSYSYADGPWDPLRRPAFLNIARGTSVRMEPSSHPAVLRLQGVTVDKVTALANTHLDIPRPQIVGPMAEKDFLLERKARHAEECDTVMSRLQTYPTGESLETVLWKTLICGVTRKLDRAPEDPYAASYVAWRKCLRQEFSDIEDLKLTQARQKPFRETIDEFNGRKIFGRTANGYVGLFNMSTRTDDIVVAMFGGEFPFVLRRRPTWKADPKHWDHELVGQCYIHGLMEEGQFDIQSSKYKAQWFNLGGEFEVEPPFQPHGVISPTQ